MMYYSYKPMTLASESQDSFLIVGRNYFTSNLCRLEVEAENPNMDMGLGLQLRPLKAEQVTRA